MSFQFPCAAKFEKRGWQKDDECRLCKILYLDLTASSECLGHIQLEGYCKALQSPKIVVRHGIWRCKWSVEENEDGSRKWIFHTSVSTVKHKEWKMREIPAHRGLMTDTQRGHSVVGSLRALAITEFHYEMDLGQG